MNLKNIYIVILLCITAQLINSEQKNKQENKQENTSKIDNNKVKSRYNNNAKKESKPTNHAVETSSPKTSKLVHDFTHAVDAIPKKETKSNSKEYNEKADKAFEIYRKIRTEVKISSLSESDKKDLQKAATEFGMQPTSQNFPELFEKPIKDFLLAVKALPEDASEKDSNSSLVDKAEQAYKKLHAASSTFLITPSENTELTTALKKLHEYKKMSLEWKPTVSSKRFKTSLSQEKK
jgi:hypothetical protein